MNERIYKHVKTILAGFGACLLSFGFLLFPVSADASALTSTKVYFTGQRDSYSPYYIQVFVSYSGMTSNNIPFQMLKYKLSNENAYRFLFWMTDDQYNNAVSTANNSTLNFAYSTSTNGLVYTGSSFAGSASWQTYTGNDNNSGTIGTTIHYQTNVTYDINLNELRSFTFANVPVINLNSTSSLTDILYVLSLDLSGPYPWEGTSSSGGRYWSDGTSLSGEDTSKYENIFIVMDSNHDNSVSQEEVNYYNFTYNTNYDYSTINEGNTFNEDQFLYWVATIISSGNDNPGGGTGSGSNGSSGGGVVIEDGAISQTQTQSIAENAVNVSVTNNNSFDPQNVNNLNSLINNNIGNQEGTNAITEAVYNINLMTGLARRISSLIGIILGFLPWWASTIVGIMFSILAVMVVFRLIHLFI